MWPNPATLAKMLPGQVAALCSNRRMGPATDMPGMVLAANDDDGLRWVIALIALRHAGPPRFSAMAPPERSQVHTGPVNTLWRNTPDPPYCHYWSLRA